MGVMETAVALRHHSPADVADVVCLLLRDVGHRVEPSASPSEPSPDSWGDVLIGRETAGWVVVRPNYLVQPDLFAVQLSRRLATVASAVSIYEDVLWTHDLVDRGRVVDRYVNLPGYFGPGEYGPEHAGDPALVAEVLGVDAAQVEPYFRQVSVRRARSRFLPPPKAHAADRYDLLDGWVVTELWARMGIVFPEPGDAHVWVPLGDTATWALNTWLRESPDAR